MLILCRIPCVDSRDGACTDRDLWLKTESLEPTTRSAVELLARLNDPARRRDWLRYRQLFQEGQLSEAELHAEQAAGQAILSFFIHDYYEDENGQPLSPQQLGEILTGEPNTLLLPTRAKRHDVVYSLAHKRPLSVDKVELAADDLRALAYFVRDLGELRSSAFFAEGPGKLKSIREAAPVLETAADDEEIRSFVTIFRRLYMEKEAGRFTNAVDVFSRALREFPEGKWIAGVRTEYETALQSPPGSLPRQDGGRWSFTRKRLIDVFLYTRYAHQPDAKHTRQFAECLKEAGDRSAALTWLFLSEIWCASLLIANAGSMIAFLFDAYCQAHGAPADVLASVATEHPGIGKQEKKEDRERRLFEESARCLAVCLWNKRERPAGGPEQFLDEARRDLRNKIKDSGSEDEHPA